jgi:hypothetical protein
LLAVPGVAATHAHKVKHAVPPHPPLHRVPSRRASRHYSRRSFSHRVPNRRAKAPLSRRKAPFRNSKHPMSRSRRRPIHQARVYHRRPYRRYYRRPVRYRFGPSSDRINQIQRALARTGFYQGDPTGRWDDNTIQAMKSFQQAKGLPPTGKIDAPSLQMLGLGSAIAGLAPPRPLIGANPMVDSTKESKTGAGITR